MLIRQRRETLEAERFDPEAEPWPSCVKRCADENCERPVCFRVKIGSEWFGIEPGSVIVRRPGRMTFVVGPEEFRREWEVVEGRQ